MRRQIVFALLLGVGACAVQQQQAAAPSPGGPGYVVFFQQWSAAIDTPAQSVIDAAARAAKANPAARVTVSAYADTTGSAQANVYLTQTRAQVVTDALVQDGVDPTRIAQQPQGATPGVGGTQESRRVVISVGG
jgi:outer membrane protein OmpA-like peptidoglycan-associated protein